MARVPAKLSVDDTIHKLIYSEIISHQRLIFDETMVRGECVDLDQWNSILDMDIYGG